jgi:C4-dicarboxylate transporter
MLITTIRSSVMQYVVGTKAQANKETCSQYVHIVCMLYACKIKGQVLRATDFITLLSLLQESDAYEVIMLSVCLYVCVSH